MSIDAAQRAPLTAAVECHRGEVHRYLSGRVGCAETAADLFQSIVENLLRREADPPIRNVRAYLFQAARHAVSNHRRDAQVQLRTYSETAPLLDNDERRSPERVVEGQEALAILAEAIQDLPVLTRQMFVLYRVHGLKQAEIARRFDVHLSTVEKRLKKAILHCAERLNG